jgi:hypothetical protein
MSTPRISRRQLLFGSPDVMAFGRIGALKLRNIRWSCIAWVSRTVPTTIFPMRMRLFLNSYLK